MNELVWEGLLEILRGDQPSLKASARLWRRDDFFGSDWGGQLELPVVFRRLLPPADYSVRLPAGGQGTVRVTAGPSTTSMTFPTLTGVGHPPFGGAEARPAVEVEVDREGEAPMTQEPEPTAMPAATAALAMSAVSEVAASERALTPALAAASTSSNSSNSSAASTSAASPTSSDSLEDSGHPAGGLAQVSSYAPPSPPAPRRLALVDAAPRGDEGISQTEAMARAFLAAVEARERLQAVARPGFEGRAIEAARQGTYAATETLEGALRARAGTDHWPQELAEHLVALSWFASLAVPDSQAEIAGAGRAVQALVATMRTLLVASAPASEHARAA